MEVKLQTLNNEGKGQVTISEENDPDHVTFIFSDNPEQKYSIHLENLYSAVKAMRNIIKIRT